MPLRRWLACLARQRSPWLSSSWSSTCLKLAVLNRRALHRRGDDLCQRLQLERLLQGGAVAIFMGQAGGAVAGCKDERAVARRDQLGDRRDHLAIDVDVENGEIEFSRLHQPDRFADFAGLGSYAVAQLFQHISDHHPDHDLVFNEENRTARRPCRYHEGNPCPSKALRLAKNTPGRNVDMSRHAFEAKTAGDGL